MADLKPEHAAPLAAALQPAYYVNQQMILDAIVRKSCFNVIYLANSFKVDVFVQKDREYDRTVFQRIRQDSLVSEEPPQTVLFPRPEDVVLAKLEWYRLGDEASERQWRDVIEVMMTQDEVLDRSYLRQWAAELQVADLLARHGRKRTRKLAAGGCSWPSNNCSSTFTPTPSITACRCPTIRTPGALARGRRTYVPPDEDDPLWGQLIYGAGGRSRSPSPAGPRATA